MPRKSKKLINKGEKMKNINKILQSALVTAFFSTNLFAKDQPELMWESEKAFNLPESAIFDEKTNMIYVQIYQIILQKKTEVASFLKLI